jgi:hypothetical protein
MTDPRFDRDGNRIENPKPDSNSPGEAELAAMRRAKSYAWHKNAGTLEVWYDQNDAANLPPRKRGRGGR